jgi:hypothetical protein
MNGGSQNQKELAGASREEMNSALFAHLVMQQTNMAMMLMGKVPHPESGQPIKDLEAAKLFIDLLEMLQAKTKGNLTKEEENLLRQSLTNLRMMFVEAVGSPSGAAATPEAREARPSPPAAEPAPTAQPRQTAGAQEATVEGKLPQTAAQATQTTGSQAATATEEESRKKFSKKY